MSKNVKKSINLQPIQTLNQESNLKHKQKNYTEIRKISHILVLEMIKKQKKEF